MEQQLQQKKIGIIGGGQLGAMLLAVANKWQLNTAVLDPDPQAPCKDLTPQFVVGSLTDYHSVMAFGKSCDFLTIEIEHVHIGALKDLEAMGKIVVPKPAVLEQIQDKGTQKTIFANNNIPTAPFLLFELKEDLVSHVLNNNVPFPFVWKSKKGGYDGKGVSIVENKDQLLHLPNVPCLIETLAPIQTEIAVLVASSADGQKCYYEPAAMVFDSNSNLVVQVEAPASVPPNIYEEIKQIAQKVAAVFNTTGLLAIELFVLKNGQVWVNELAPRPHNSAHYTIEACYCSQFEQHFRCLLGLPLGNAQMHHQAIMLNLVGQQGGAGKPNFVGFEWTLGIKNTYVHLYRKVETKPNRKMGHITLLGNNLSELSFIAKEINNKFKVIPCIQNPK